MMELRPCLVKKTGVQSRIRQVAPLALYTHCSGHCLNLVIAHSCQIPAIRNMLDKMTQIFLFFRNSAKREALLQNVVQTGNPEHDSSKRSPLLNLCKTRWVERHIAYRHFYQAYTYIIKAFEIIAMGIHNEEGLDRRRT